MEPRCPRCGFAYAWNGTACGHCHLGEGPGTEAGSSRGLRVRATEPVAEFSVKRAYQLAQFSDATYKDENKLDSRTLKVDFVDYLQFDPFVDSGPLGVAAIIGGNKKNLILAFRGTVMEVRNWKQLLLMAANWLVNLACDQVEHERHSCRIHRGFSHAIDNIRDQIDDAVRSRLRPGQRFWITGHSLGGALANLTANEFCAAGRVEVAGTYTFGAPRVGDAAFAESCRTPHYRIENRHDFVPHIPPPPSLVGLGRMIVEEPLNALQELIDQGFVLAAKLDKEFARALHEFLKTFTRAIRRFTELEYKHAGSLRFFDPDDDFIDLDRPIEPPEWLGWLLDEDDLRQFAQFTLDLYRLVTFLGQLVRDLECLDFSFLSDHKMCNYLSKLERLQEA